MIKPMYLLILFFTMTCQNESKRNDIDSIIKKYDKTDFSFFKNTFVGVREQSRNEITYIIEKSEGNLPVYFITYSTSKESVIDINKTALKERNIGDYFTDEEISGLIENFRKLNLSLLQVDEQENVFINPFKINEPAILLRLANPSDKEEVRKGFVYRHYKDNWYIRK
jgi:hypothetical protein